MDLKDAVDLYREALRRYSEGFSLEEVLGSVAEALGAERAVLFIRRDMDSFLEPQLAWRLGEDDWARIRERILPVDWVTRQPVRRYFAANQEKLSELGMEGMSSGEAEALLFFPIRTNAHLRAVLMMAVPRHVTLPDQQSLKVAAVCTVLERMVELFTFDDKQEYRKEEAEASSLELGILSNYLLGKTDYSRAVSLSLDLLIKLLNMDGGTVHRVRGALGDQKSVLIASRGWDGMAEIIEHLFENNLIDLLQAMRHSEEKEFSLDAGRIAEYFPGVKPYFHASQVKSFLLTPIFQDEKLVGLLTLFGRSYTAMEPKDMDLLVGLCQSLGALFSEEEDLFRGVRALRGGWNFPAIVESITRLYEDSEDVKAFLSSALPQVSIDLGAAMSFTYFGDEFSVEDRDFFWYADAIYGGEAVFKATPGLSRMSSHIQRMAVIKAENPAMKELPAGEQAIVDDLILLLIPAREKGLLLLNGFYLPSERKLSKAEMESLQPLSSMLLSLARGLRERAYAESYRRSLEILTEVEGDIAACEDPHHVMRLLVRGGRELMGCDRAAIVVIDEDRGVFEGAVETAEGLEVGDLSLLAGREIALSLAKGHALYSLQPDEDPESLYGRNEHKSIIAVPLIGRRGRLGALVFEEADRSGFFGEFQRRLAHFLAGQAVAVLESSREGARMEEQAAETETLLRITRKLSTCRSTEELCRELSKELERVTGAELCLLSVYSKAGNRRLAYFRGEKVGMDAFEELLEPRGPLMLALSQTGKVVRNNLNTFLRNPGEDGLTLRGIRSYMAVSIQGEDLKGVLLLGNTRGAAFAEREVALLEKVAEVLDSLVALPLDQESMRGRIRVLEEMCRAQEEKVRIKTDLINMASHEVRHPLTLIMGFSEVLRDYGDLLNARESVEVVGKLHKAADRLRRSVVNMMEVSRLESGKLALSVEEVDLVGMISGLIDELKARSSEYVMDMEVEPGVERIYADPDKLEVILFNLMDNAAKYSPPGSRIDVFVKRSRGEILLGVKDHGQGISEENLNLIFQPFRQGEGGKGVSAKGMGLGLYIVNRLVEAHGGRIEVRSEHGKGSTFIARIPQPESAKENQDSESDALQA